MDDKKAEKTDTIEMLSFGGVQFASYIFLAFSSYYLMMFFTDIALISPAVTAVFMVFYRLFDAADNQAIGIFINRNRFKDGKYRPYYKWCALPFAIGLAAFGMTPFISISVRFIYTAVMLLICEFSYSVLNVATTAMLPYLVKHDVNRSKFMAVSNSCSIFAFIVVGTFMLPLAGFLGGGDRNKGIALTLILYAIIAVPLIYNGYFRLKEQHYSEPSVKPAIKDVFGAIVQNRRILLFFTIFLLYFMADAFKNMTTYYYLTHIMKQPDMMPVIISAGLFSPLAMQPVIPRLLKYAKKESLIVFGLFAGSCCSLLMLAAGNRLYALAACVVLYGMLTAIASNMIFTMLAAFSDEVRTRLNISLSEILAAGMNLSSTIGVGIASVITGAVLAFVNYSPQAAVQTTAALTGIRTLYIFCTASVLALAGVLTLQLRKTKIQEQNCEQ
ncbi:MAG: MFS transporter [Treponema sp.]|nr:MFS transporter [Treponema sp.]